MKEMISNVSTSSKVTGTYDDYKKNPYFPRTIMCLQKHFTMAEKLKKMAFSPGKC